MITLSTTKLVMLTEGMLETFEVDYDKIITYPPLMNKIYPCYYNCYIGSYNIGGYSKVLED